MAVTVKPAVMSLEWGVILNADEGYVYPPNGSVQEWIPETRHAIAAVCLYDQIFGFTWEDVDHLRELALSAFAFEGSPLPGVSNYNLWLWYESLADRIAALLAPRSDA